MIYFQTDRGVLHQGHVIDILQEMPPESVHCGITSPPYWTLRDYNIEGQVWDEIPDNCYECPQHNKGPCTICHCLGKEHVWGEIQGQTTTQWADGVGNKGDTLDDAKIRKERRISQEPSQGQFCQHCKAWKGSLGLEPTVELYLSHLVQVFREVWRVLHPSGTIWVNMGDSYAANRSYQVTDNKHISVGNEMASQIPPGLKPKDLIGIPWRVALALQADGWWLRSALPWVKRSSMPESCTDRPASALEYMFLLSKSQHYFFDMDAVRQNIGELTRRPTEFRGGNIYDAFDNSNPNLRKSTFKETEPSLSGRNFRNTDLFYESITPPHGMIFCGDELVGLDVNPQAYKDAHFATFSERLVEPCLKAGTSEKGCCPECLAPWERVTELTPEYKELLESGKAWRTSDGKPDKYTKRQEKGHPSRVPTKSKTIGWKPGCECYKGIRVQDPIPCTVMDIFGGSGTAAVVAEKHRRNWILIELSSDYCELAKDRIQQATKQRRLF